MCNHLFRSPTSLYDCMTMLVVVHGGQVPCMRCTLCINVPGTIFLRCRVADITAGVQRATSHDLRVSTSLLCCCSAAACTRTVIGYCEIHDLAWRRYAKGSAGKVTRLCVCQDTHLSAGKAKSCCLLRCASVWHRHTFLKETMINSRNTRDALGHIVR